MYLHEAITTILESNNNSWMTYSEITEAIHSRNLYLTKEGNQPESGQISARANKHHKLFEFDKSDKLVRIRLIR